MITPMPPGSLVIYAKDPRRACAENLYVVLLRARAALTRIEAALAEKDNG